MANEELFHHRKVGVSGGQLHVVTAGDPARDESILFLHGWPQEWSSMRQLMMYASQNRSVAALDLPGIGGSLTAAASGAKSTIARRVIELIDTLRLRNVTVVGHDVGGMVAFACLRAGPARFRAAVIMSVVIPGLKPWEEVLRNPHIWHFGFHNIPVLPELLVAGKERAYFDFFFNNIAAHPERIDKAARERYVAAYDRPSALKAGFDWYRGFAEDAKENAVTDAIETPVLYLRGTHEPGDISSYADGLRTAGIKRLYTALVEDSGHFTPEEQPAGVWREIERFLQATPGKETDHV
jgi:pimeloyl-ACP methyl ester carboxylesterase